MVGNSEKGVQQVDHEFVGMIRELWFDERSWGRLIDFFISMDISSC